MLIVVAGFVLRWRDVAAPGMKPAMVVPVHPFQCGQFQVFKVTPRPVSADQLRLVQTDHGLRERIIVGIPDSTGRTVQAGSGKCCGVTDRKVLATVIAVVNGLSFVTFRCHRAISRASRGRSVRMWSASRHPTMNRA